MSRVLLPHSLLNKWDKMGASVISRYGTLRISSDTLTSMASGQQDVTLSFQQVDVQRAQQIRDWAEQQSSLTLMGPVTDIKANVTGTSTIILPLDNESLGELHNAEPQFSILVIHENSEREILKGTAVMDSKGFCRV